MGSPFPGMDPYLEDPAIWPDVHHGLISAIRSVLQPRLRPRYTARIDVRLVIEEPPAEGRRPDVAVFRVSDPELRYAATTDAASPAAADEPVTILAMGEPIRQGFIEVRLADGGELVTVIEVLSPTNKKPGPGRNKYLDKQSALLNAEVSLVEIDLLREGQHTIAAPLYSLGRLTGHYWVCVHRAGEGMKFEMYAVSLRERLPRVKVPLRSPDPDVVLDLPAAFGRCYDEADYGPDIDYTGEPAVALEPEDAAWASELLTAAGMRTADAS